MVFLNSSKNALSSTDISHVENLRMRFEGVSSINNTIRKQL